MRNAFGQISSWTWLTLVAALAPLAAWAGASAGWSPGAATLAVLVIPVAAASLAGRRDAALGTAAIFAVGALLEVLLADSMDGATAVRWLFPLTATVVVFAMALVICAVAGGLREESERLEEQNTLHVRELYRRDRGETPPTDASSPPEGRERIVNEIGKVDYAMLLLTLQDIGRRISLNLDSDTLVPTIITTARASLKCGSCELWFWNAAENSLRPGRMPQGNEAGRYLPRAEIGMAGWVLEHRQILTRRAVREDYGLRSLLEDDPHQPDAVAPLTVGGELIGLLIVDEIEEESPNFLRLLYILANIYALGIKNGQLFRRIEDMARRDGMTGLLNHVAFQQRLEELAQDAGRTGASLTVVMSDIDRFKQFNDEHGHQAGDLVLAETARLWRALLPESAVIARYGGEEFICALPQTALEEGEATAERLRAGLASHPFDFEGRPLRVTASFGVVAFSATASTPRDLIRLADVALYQAKEAGRDRVVTADEHVRSSV